MSNNITQQYHSLPDLRSAINSYLRTICEETGISLHQEIFRGEIYDDSKVGSVIYQIQFQGKPAILKLQMLRPIHEEADITAALSQYIGDTRIGFPEVLYHQAWDISRGFGYTIFTTVVGQPIYATARATDIEQKDFMTFFEEYRNHLVGKNIFPPDDVEQSVRAFINHRIYHHRSNC